MTQEVARMLGAPDIELYLSPSATAIALENSSPPALILPEGLVRQSRGRELRFLLGYGIGRIRAGLVAASKISLEELGQFVAAMLVLEVGSFVPPYPKDTIEALSRRIQKTLSKKALRELGPYALEVAGHSLQP